jgi:hypothetical protein
MSNKEILLHFTEILARALLLPLISKKSKVRIAALEAIGVKKKKFFTYNNDKIYIYKKNYI